MKEVKVRTAVPSPGARGQRHENVGQRGSVVYQPERNDRGQFLLWLSEAEANRLAATTPTRGVVQ